MPLVTQPNSIELSDFRGGWSPDGENPTTDATTLIDVLNLLPDRNTGSLVTRKGFKRLREEMFGSDSFVVKQLFHFITPSEKYLIVVLSTEATGANNVRLYAISLSNNSVQRMDSAGVNWSNPKANHWGVGIDNIWYGGSQGNNMYSWDPSGPTWDSNASNGTWKTWVNAVNDSVTLATEWPKDYAWEGDEKVVYSGSTYSPARSLREDQLGRGFPNWESGKHYSKGDRVLLKATWVTTNSYYKQFRCIKQHDSDSTNKPEVGSGSPGTYWEKTILDHVLDDDSNTSKDWDFIPTAAQTSVAEWHADRLFMRYDDQGDKSRLLYSAPIKPVKGMDVADTEWDPTDFQPGNDQKGAGGGWLPFNDGKHGGIVEALHSTGNYLLVFKRRAVWALSGFDETTWNPRRLAKGVGAVGPRAVTEMDGLVYFLSDDGLYVTDGNAVQPVPGNERVQAWLRARMDVSLQDGLNRDPELTHFDGRVFISLPSHSDTDPYVTLVYDPYAQGFWYLDLPVLSMVTYRDDGVSKLAFGASPDYSTRDLVYQYDHASAGDADDTGLDAYASTDVAWSLTTAWLGFGTAREERRIRRVWASLKATAQSVTVTLSRNWAGGTTVGSVTRTSTGSAQYMDGVKMPDSWAIRVKLSGTKLKAAIYGIAIDTQPRRRRYHS